MALRGGVANIGLDPTCLKRRYYWQSVNEPYNSTKGYSNLWWPLFKCDVIKKRHQRRSMQFIEESTETKRVDSKARSLKISMEGHVTSSWGAMSVSLTNKPEPEHWVLTLRGCSPSPRQWTAVRAETLNSWTWTFRCFDKVNSSSPGKVGGAL